jgi:hypothetical protein
LVCGWRESRKGKRSISKDSEGYPARSDPSMEGKMQMMVAKIFPVRVVARLVEASEAPKHLREKAIEDATQFARMICPSLFRNENG